MFFMVGFLQDEILMTDMTEQDVETFCDEFEVRLDQTFRKYLSTFDVTLYEFDDELNTFLIEAEDFESAYKFANYNWINNVIYTSLEVLTSRLDEQAS